jgi:hypothetical protein
VSTSSSENGISKTRSSQRFSSSHGLRRGATGSWSFWTKEDP